MDVSREREFRVVTGGAVPDGGGGLVVWLETCLSLNLGLLYLMIELRCDDQKRREG
jgi:hypothetical protein